MCGCYKTNFAKRENFETIIVIFGGTPYDWRQFALMLAKIAEGNNFYHTQEPVFARGSEWQELQKTYLTGSRPDVKVLNFNTPLTLNDVLDS